MKDLLCEAFCDSLDVRTIPAGFAVRTPYATLDGDPLLLYLMRERDDLWRIEDDGAQVALVEGSGADLSGKTRREVFERLLHEYGASFDENTRTLSTPPYAQGVLGSAALRFVGLLLRLQDLALLAPHTVRSTFRDDALVAIREAFGNTASIEEAASLSPAMLGHEADVVIRHSTDTPVAVYFATSEERALMALVSKMEAEKYLAVEGKVVLMVERAKNNPVREATYGLALARLDGVLSFREAQGEAMRRIVSLAGDARPVGPVQ
jgi:hypothetical protein